MHRLEGKVAIVTGAANGIGKAIAEGMAREGAKVIVADKSIDKAAAVASGIVERGGQARAQIVDVSIRSEVEGLVAVCTAEFGVPSILVCSAGIAFVAEAQDIIGLTDQEWDGVLGVNLTGTFLCAQTVARSLVKSGSSGSIITVSSIGAERPTIGAPAYHASKGGVVGFTRSLAVNLAKHGIRSNAIAPGYIVTEMTRDGLEDPAILSTIENRIPLGSMGSPDDLVGAAIFLASDEASYVTGQVIGVDGGALVLGWTSAQTGEAR